MKNKIVIITGDPNSINSEIIYKSWKKINISIKKRIYFISNFQLLQKQFEKLNYRINLEKVESINQNSKNNKLKILDIDLKFKNPFRVPEKSTSKFVINSLNQAHKLALNKKVIGIINCAINKKIFKNKIGVTEYLAKKCKVKNNSEVMLITNKKYSVSPLTTHIDIKEVSKNIKSRTFISKVKTIDKWFKKNFKKKPKIGVLGLNPHNAELRKDSKEKKVIIPTIYKLKKLGINIKGPLVSDTIFLEDYKKYDVIVGMYHDQVLSPFKALFKFDAINVTLGLKYLRVSPDHGTAVNLIGKNKAKSNSLLKCISFLSNLNK